MPTRILLVEDSPTQAEALRSTLESSDYEVTVAKDGLEGVARFDAAEFDVVISDILMPGPVDGYKLCRQIKNSARGRETPVVLLTSLSSPLDIIHGLESGADNFFTKPFDAAHFVERLQTLLRTRRARTEGRMRVGIEVFFMGHKFLISSEREQILDLLISTFEDAVRQNQDLRRREGELTKARAELDRYARMLEGRLESVLRSVPDMLFSLRPDLGELYYVSPAAAKVTGYDPEELTQDAAHVFGLIDAADAERFDVAVQRARAGREAVVEHRLKHRDGSTRWLSTTIVPVRDDDGTLLRLEGITHDITKRRQLEEQFRQAQKMETIGRLTGGIAHDFNNLLTVIRSYCDFVMEDTKADDPRREDLSQIRAAADSASTLARQLLTFSRPQLLLPAVLDLNEIVKTVNTMLKRITGATVRVETRLAPGLGLVKADPGHIEQLLMNLAINAVDAMPDGGTLTIKSANAVLDDEYAAQHPGVAPGTYVLLTISDTGTGMDKSTLARVFEPFFTTKPPGKGTGLGLATVYGIVQQSGGHCTVSSEPGQGTTFQVHFPRVAAEARDAERVAAAAAAAAGGVRSGERGAVTVLVVEDEAPLRRSLVRILEQRGYRALGAAGGKEALRVADEHAGPIPLVISDIMMPEMSGREFAEQLVAKRPESRVLFMSGFPDDELLKRGALGASRDFIKKPFTIDGITQKVREVLDRA